MPPWGETHQPKIWGRSHVPLPHAGTPADACPRYDEVLPAFDERDALGLENVYPGWLPPTGGGRGQKRPLSGTGAGDGPSGPRFRGLLGGATEPAPVGGMLVPTDVDA